MLQTHEGRSTKSSEDTHIRVLISAAGETSGQAAHDQGYPLTHAERVEDRTDDISIALIWRCLTLKTLCVPQDSEGGRRLPALTGTRRPPLVF
jgi:hypothetical protein